MKNETGNKYGRLLVIEQAGKRRKEALWRCLCDCGKYTEVVGYSLRSGNTLSCGCYRSEVIHDRDWQDLSDSKFGRWVVSSQYKKSSSGRYIWWCTCECGTQKFVKASTLVSGASASCGCLRSEKLSETKSSDLTGKQFGYLRVLSFEGSRSIGKGKAIRRYYKCLCKCGNEKIVSSLHLVAGSVQSCGCFMREKSHRPHEGRKSPYPVEFNVELRRSVRKRDNQTCQLCGASFVWPFLKSLHVHHIDSNKHNNLEANLICLCAPCHSKMGVHKNKDSWISYWQGYMEATYG